jgi:presenilin-like A22 family membrane protease
MININQVKNQNVYKTVKYILMALFIFVAIKYIPQKILKMNEIILITFSSIIVFIILDTISPSVNVNFSCEKPIKNP